MFKIKIYLSFLMIVVISGCTHPMQISPDLSDIRGGNSSKSSTNVGYYISSDDMNTKVTTDGGGGDDVSYFPYKDTEAALKTILSQKFSKVYALKSKDNDPIIKDKNINFIFTPKIRTKSSSSSGLTWPPTDFTLELSCRAYSRDGSVIWEKTVVGEGHADYPEFLADFSMSAKRASVQAFKLMRDEILAAKVLK